MGNLFGALLARPDLMAEARVDEAARAAIVHELLRWEGPLATLPRVAPFDAIVAGEAVQAGTMLLFGIAAANRDPRAWPAPDDFDPSRFGRSQEDIVTFGFGQKFCPGSHLARRQLVTALDVLLDRLPDLRLIDDTGAAPRGGVLRHPSALHVAWERP